jgi:hypothetical protein
MNSAADIAGYRTRPLTHSERSGPFRNASEGWVPTSVLAAAVLSAEGADLIVVGSTALWLHGEPIGVHDLDVVINPRLGNLSQLGDALASLGVRPAESPPLHLLTVVDLIGVPTRYGRVDLLLARGRLDFAVLDRHASWFDVHGARVRVASRADTWSLRARYKAESTDD